MYVRVTLNCQINTDKIDTLITFLKQNLPNVRQFPGNIRVNILFDPSRKEMLIDEDWASIEEHKAYIKFITENGIMQELVTYFLVPPIVKYFAPQDL